MTAALPDGLGPTSGRKLKVLVAEDNLINQRIVVGSLTN